MKHIRLILILILTAAASCKDSDVPTSTLSGRNEIRDVEGGQEVSRSSNDGISEASIFIPDGANIDSTSLQIEDGASVANHTTASYLSYPGEILGTGKSINVVLSNSTYDEQVGSLVLSLPVPTKPSVALTLTGNFVSSLAVFYHVNTSTDGKAFGFIPESFLRLKGDSVAFNLRGFGNYQVAWVSISLDFELKVETDEPVQKQDVVIVRSGSGGTGSRGGGSGGATSTTSSGTSGSSGSQSSSSPFSLAAGSNETCAVSTSGRLYCWGLSPYHPFGAGQGEDRLIPTRVGTESDWVSVHKGESFGCAVKQNGALYCWGFEAYAGAGNYSTVRNSPTFVALPNNDSVWLVGIGEGHRCVLSKVGKAYCWGGNGEGQLGIGSAEQVPSASVPMEIPNIVFKKLAVGKNHNCAIDAQDELYCWGMNNVGQSASPGASAAIRPARVQDQSGVTLKWKDITAGAEHSCGISVSGNLFCWGLLESNDLNVPGVFQPRKIGSLTDWEKVSAGGWHTCALRGGGALHCWGKNNYGQVGSYATQGNSNAEGSTTPSYISDPTSIGDLSDVWNFLALGAEHTCARKANRSIYCWGQNEFGQIGNGSTDFMTPLVVVGNDGF